MILPVPDAFAAAYFAACVILAGGIFCAALIAVAYVCRGRK